MGTVAVDMGRVAKPVMLINAGDMELLDKLREAESRIVDNGGGYNRISMEIGWDGYFIKRHHGWSLLGYTDEKTFRHAMGIGRSTWYKVTGIAERLAHLSREEFVTMSVDNAEQLSLQPMSVMRDPDLIAKAQLLTAEELSDELALAVAVHENKPPEDRYVTMKWRLKQAQRKVIERGLDDWQKEHGLDDPIYALELLIAETTQRPTLVGFMRESVDRLSREVLQAQTPEELMQLKGSFAIHLHEMDECLSLCCGAPADSERSV